MPRHTFNYLLINHLKKIKFEKDKKYKIVISIFSENRDLISTCKGLKDDIDKEENNEKKFFLRNIGFCPEDKIDKFKVEYKLYDPEEQLLTYHLFFNISKEIKISKSILLVEFVKTNVNIAIYYKSEIIKKLKGKEINFKDLNFDKIDEIEELLIGNSYINIENSTDNYYNQNSKQENNNRDKFYNTNYDIGGEFESDKEFPDNYTFYLSGTSKLKPKVTINNMLTEYTNQNINNYIQPPKYSHIINIFISIFKL